jgi:hypothetical protein
MREETEGNGGQRTEDGTGHEIPGKVEVAVRVKDGVFRFFAR